MKTKSKFFALFFIFGILCLSFAGCDDDPTPLSPDEARTEMELAYSDLMMNMDLMMQSSAMEAMMMLMNISGFETDFDMKSGAQQVIDQSLKLPDRMFVMGKTVYSISNSSLKDEEVPTGVFYYNFDTGEFDLIDDDVDYIEIHFPATDEAYASQQLNAIIRITDLVMEEVIIDDVTEIVPSKIVMWMEVDGAEVMNLDFQMSVDSEGFPDSVSLVLNMEDYNLTMSFSGSNLNYNTNIIFKESNNTLLDVDLDIMFLEGREDVESVAGYIHLVPIRLDGSVDIASLELCEDIDCMNNNIDVEVIQTEDNEFIGHLEFRMQYDPEYDEEYPTLVVVYSDGSFDFLDELFDIDFDI